MPEVFSSLIQSDFGGDHGNFEAIVRVGDELLHFWRDNSDPFQSWRAAGRVSDRVAYAGAIIQSHLIDAEHGNLEVVVPLHGPAGHAELWHFFLDAAHMERGWQRVQRITDAGDVVAGPASLVPSDFGEPDNFELVVPLMVASSGHGELWHFFHDNSHPGPWGRGQRVTAPEDKVVGPGSIIQGSRGPDGNNFEVVVPIIGASGQPELRHYFHDSSNPGGPWGKARRVTGPADVVAGGGVILESDFGEGDHGNLEVVVPLVMPPGHIELWHFWHDDDPNSEWRRGALISASAGRGVSFTRSSFHFGDHLNFELLTEECKQSIVHYFRHNERPDNPWLRTGPIVAGTLTGEQPAVELCREPGPCSTRKICQLTGEFDLEGWDALPLGELSSHGPTVAAHALPLVIGWKGAGNEQLNLSVSDDNGESFHGRKVLGDTSRRAPALASDGRQVSLAWAGSGNNRLNVARVIVFANTAGVSGIEGIEQKVLLDDRTDGRPALAFHDGKLFLAWKGAGNDAVGIVFSTDGGRTFRGKRVFERMSGAGPALASHHGKLYLAWKGTGNDQLNVARLSFFGTTAGGFGIEGLVGKVTLPHRTDAAPALVSHGDRLFLAWKGSRGVDLGIAVSDDDGASFHGGPRVSAARRQIGGTLPTDALTAAGPALASRGGALFSGFTRLDGSVNVARYLDTGRREVPFGTATNRTESQAGILGTDLGTAFSHGGRIFFLFGDTWRAGQSEDDPSNLDAIAFAATGQDPERGLALTFNPLPPRIAQLPPAGQGEFEVPLDGVSFGGAMFVFFTTDNRAVAHRNMIERSIVARSNDDGLTFTLLRDFSHDKLVQVSLDVAKGADVGLPTFGDTLLIWGTSQRFRSSDVYLAAMPLEEIASGRFVRHWAGSRDGEPVWLADGEAQAVPLFRDGSVGELSVRWNPFLERFLLLYLSDNPAGIVLRTARKPWGPWSEPARLFERWRNPFRGSVLHTPFRDRRRHDWNYDFLQGDQENTGDRQNFGGDPYAPGIIAPLMRGVHGLSTDVYFTLSTWNPYQVILMKTSILGADLQHTLSLERETRIAWPSRLVASAGELPSEFGVPEDMLGPPDGKAQTVVAGLTRTLGDFRGVEYSALVDLLGPGHVKLGDRVSAETLARVDVVAFERNGFAPDTGNGWESCDWSFGDGTATVSVGWDGRAGAPRDRHVVANGSIAGADYKAYFGPPGTPIHDHEVISFLLFALPELRTDAAGFTVEVKGRAGAGEGSPDVDAVGIVARA